MEKAIAGMSPRSMRTIMWMEKVITQMHPRSMRTMMPYSYLGSSAKGHPHRGACGEAGQNGWEN
eukprot:3563690-Rhodomonas_salina.2